jgi:protein-tyrosine-phosphatase
MAEYALRMLLEKERPGEAEVFSSGTAAADGYPATQYAQEAGKIWHLDLSPHSSQMLSAQLIERADLILCMTSQHHHEVTRLDGQADHKTFLLKNFPDNHPVGEPVDDPIGQSLDKYNEAFLEIAEYLGKHLPEILRLIDARQDA